MLCKINVTDEIQLFMTTCQDKCCHTCNSIGPNRLIKITYSRDEPELDYLRLIKYGCNRVGHVDDTSGVTLDNKQKAVCRLKSMLATS